MICVNSQMDVRNTFSSAQIVTILTQNRDVPLIIPNIETIRMTISKVTAITITKITKMPIKTAEQSVKKFVTFSVEKLSVYKSLQWTLDSTKHTQNKVLATQSDCPADLSIAEYKEFGSLRADGHRLQYRNLYRTISDESLSFETPSVLALVMQALWEAGPGGIQWYREANEDFVDLDFVRATHDLLAAYIRD